jgi:hypothetical protein
MRKGPLRSHTRTALKLRPERAPLTEGNGHADNRAMAYSIRNVFRVRYRDPSDFTKANRIQAVFGAAMIRRIHGNLVAGHEPHSAQF